MEDPLFVKDCNFDYDVGRRYLSFTNVITFRHRTGIRSLAPYYEGFLLNYTISKHHGVHNFTAVQIFYQNAPNKLGSEGGDVAGRITELLFKF